MQTDTYPLRSSVEEHLEKYEKALKRHTEKLSKLYHSCFLHTFDALSHSEDGAPNGYVVTGDIPAMWLRDSSTQVWNYVRFAKEPAIGAMIRSVLERQFRYICIDPYANAFNETANGHGHVKDVPLKDPWVWERKYELDSLAYPLRLLYGY